MADNFTDLVRKAFGGVGKWAARSELFNMFAGAVYGWARKRLDSNAEAALEVSQEVWVKVFRSRGPKEPGCFKAWLYKIAIRACADYGRIKGKEEKLVPTTAGQGHVFDPSDPRPGEEGLRLDLEDAMERLASQEKLAIVLFHYQNLTYEEIADRLHKSVPAVKMILFRARVKLRAYLKAYYPG